MPSQPAGQRENQPAVNRQDGPAPRRNPAAFPLDDRRVYDAYIAGRQSASIAAAVRAGLFDTLDAEGPLTADELAQRLGWSARGARSMLVALFAQGLVHRDSAERYCLAPDAEAYLVRGRPGSLAGLVDLEVDGFLSPSALLSALAADRATVYGDADPWEAHTADPAKARAFTAAMHAISERPAAGLAEVAPLKGNERVLDVGGGSGALSIALARRHAGLLCIVFDMPVVCPLALEYADAAGVASQVAAFGGDMFEGPWPAGHDTVLLSQILHDWSFETGRGLVERAYEALPPGGLLLVHEKLVDDDERGPLANALVHLDMLVWTEGQQYTFAELSLLLTKAGFEGVERRPTAGYWTLVSARRGS